MIKRYRLGAFGALLAMIGVAANAAEPAAPSAAKMTCDLSAQSADVAAARATLLASVEPDVPDDTLTDLSPATKIALAQYKDAIAALIAARFECASPEQKPDALAASLNSAAAPGACDTACSEHGYSGAPDFAATRIDDSRHLLALTARLSVPCGSDSTLFLYRQEGLHWRETLRWQAAPYNDTGGAQSGLAYRIAPPDANGDWYVLVKSTPVQCNGMWYAIHYAALRATADPQHPQVLHRGNDSIYLGIDREEPFVAEADAFELRYHAYSIDSGVLVRPVVRRFAVHGNEVERIPPFAENARDFVDEWIVTRWGRIAAWSSDDPAAALESWHARVRGGGTSYYAEFRSAHACDGRGDAVEVEIERDSSDLDQDGVRYFLRVERTPQDFHMVRVGTKSDAGCGGEDLLPALRMP